MTRPDRALAEAVAAADPGVVLPRRTRAAEHEVPGPLRLRDALPLAPALWLAVVIDLDGRLWSAPVVLESGTVRRAVPGDGAAEALVGLLADPTSDVAAGSTADTTAEIDGAFEVRRWAARAVVGERAVTVDQTQESVVVGEAAVVKWSVHMPQDPPGSPSRHPAPDRITVLADAGFDAMPTAWGLLQWRPTPPDPPLLVATVAALLPGAVDGWEWAVADVRAFASGIVPLAQAVQPARTLGSIVAAMHAVLAGQGVTAADSATVQQWSLAAAADLSEALALVDGEEGARLAARADRIAEALAPMADAVGTPMIDGHGDLHVGQVLRHGDPPRYAIIDFDGNPVRPPSERADRQPAAADVAGMLASLDHVGRVVVRRSEGVEADRVQEWIDAAESAFLQAYRAGLAERGLTDLLDEPLLRPLRLQQECREFLYAVHHLPHWRYVPDAALAHLLPDP